MNQNNNQNKNNNPRQVRRKNDFSIILLAILLLVGFWLAFSSLTKEKPETLTWDTYIQYVEEGKIETATATPVGGENYLLYTIKGTYDKNGTSKSYKIVIEKDLLNYLMVETDSNGNNLLTINIKTLSSNVWLSILISLLPFVLLIGVIVYTSKTGGGNNKAFDFVKNRATLSREKNITFKDVAGCDEEKEELVEVVDFLKSPKKYVDMGARIPKGILLFGPPGTGKTLLAKAVAGEANVPFFSISGSDFVEMFVGVGASRVRDLFKVAKENHPCIIFIDEIDAVGRQRGAGMGGGHDEREQTLNQLLVEMDGFTANLGIIIIAATNRPDVLDPALLRPGRFDRQITISTPDVAGREAILKIHARNKRLASDVNLNQLAQRIPGFSGADIENLLNEAAILAARENRNTITIQDLDEATDRVLMGPAKKTRRFSEHERDIVAHHEAGHAVIGLKLDNANIVQKVTIIPRGSAGGYALMLPEEEKFLETKKSLTDRITGLLGGRVAEQIIFNEVSTGASNDFQQATKIARAMVTEYGMSNLGPVQYEQSQGSVFLGRDYLKDKNFSDQIALEIDQETRRIIEECYERATTVINQNKDLLCTIAKYLKKVETLTKADIDEINETGKLSRADNNTTPAVEPTIIEEEKVISPEVTTDEEIIEEYNNDIMDDFHNDIKKHEDR